MRYRLILCLFASLLSGCGFALRGGDQLSADFSTLLLNLQQPSSELSRLLRRSLTSADIEVELIEQINEEASVSGIPVLQVADEQIVSRPVTVNPRARAAQYELRMSVTIALGRSGAYLIEPESLVVQRIYFEDIENISGNREEVEIISAEMRRELVLQLMRRLEAVEI